VGERFDRCTVKPPLLDDGGERLISVVPSRNKRAKDDLVSADLLAQLVDFLGLIHWASDTCRCGDGLGMSVFSAMAANDVPGFGRRTGVPGQRNINVVK
jgi:hypothetical protein